MHPTRPSHVARTWPAAAVGSQLKLLTTGEEASKANEKWMDPQQGMCCRCLQTCALDYHYTGFVFHCFPLICPSRMTKSPTSSVHLQEFELERTLSLSRCRIILAIMICMPFMKKRFSCQQIKSTLIPGYRNKISE